MGESNSADSEHRDSFNVNKRRKISSSDEMLNHFPDIRSITSVLFPRGKIRKRDKSNERDTSDGVVCGSCSIVFF
jgi:hypothetical protein